MVILLFLLLGCVVATTFIIPAIDAMPRQRQNNPIITGNIRHLPIRQVQAEYYPSQAFNASQVIQRLFFQMEMFSVIENSHIMFGDIFEFIEIIRAADTEADVDGLLEEARI